LIYVGTDLVETGRIAAMIAKWAEHFLERIFTPEEIAYCRRQRVPAVHFAGRFAAKEAVKKALYSSGHEDPIIFKDIHIDRTPHGAPLVRVNHKLDGALQVSISHTAGHAVATAIYERHA